VEAAKVLARLHAKGDLNDPVRIFIVTQLLVADKCISFQLITFEMAEIKKALARETEAARTTSFWNLINTRRNKRCLAIILLLALCSVQFHLLLKCRYLHASNTVSQWSGNGLVSYCVHSILNGVGITSAGLQLLINASLQVLAQVQSTSLPPSPSYYLRYHH
jgi:hypothetical protein